MLLGGAEAVLDELFEIIDILSGDRGRPLLSGLSWTLRF